jgi:pimeloyl-ACP methyl ester carboxylesterase
MQLLTNDAAGLLNALKISKADVMGYSLGSFIAEQFTMMYLDKVNSLTLVLQHVVGKTIYLNHQSLRNCRSIL